MLEKFTKNMTQEELKHIRRREYYNRRVAKEFAPPRIEDEIPVII